jgi:hypothetical protein
VLLIIFKYLIFNYKEGDGMPKKKKKEEKKEDTQTATTQ